MTETTTKPRVPRKADSSEKPIDRREPKTRVRASVLRGALKDVTGIVEGRNTIPILDHVVLQVQDQRITLTASDLDHWAVRDCASDDRDGPASKEWLDGIRRFSVALPAKPLADVLGELDGDTMVTIAAPAEVDEEWKGQVTIAAGSARFRLHALPVSDFPLPPPLEVDSAFGMTCSQLADVLAAVDHAISTEETRYYLNGVYLHPEQLDLRFAATDGHRMARWSLDGPAGSASFPPVIVARKTVGVLEKLLASAVKAQTEDQSPAMVEIEATASGARLRFAMLAADGGSVEVVAKAVDGTFPDYQRIIPLDRDHRLTIDRATLSSAVKRVAVLADGKSRAVKLSLAEGKLTLSVRSIELGEASEEIACEYFGPELELGFDSKYLREALAALASDTVALQFNADAAGPVRISGWEDGGEVGALLQVLMPVAGA